MPKGEKKKKSNSSSSSSKDTFVLHNPYAIRDEAAKHYGSTANIRHSRLDDCIWLRERYKAPITETALESASVVSIQIGPFNDMEIKIDKFPLVIEGWFEVTIQQTISPKDLGDKPSTNPKKISLNSNTTGFWTPPSSGITFLFNNYECFINGTYKDELSSVSCQDFQSQAFLTAVDRCFCADLDDDNEYIANGNIAVENNGAVDNDELKRKIAVTGRQDYHVYEAQGPDGVSIFDESPKLRTYFGKIPVFPAAGLSNRDKYLCKFNNGYDPRLSPSEPTIPVNTKLEFVLRKKPDEELMYKMFSIKYVESMQSSSTTAQSTPPTGKPAFKKTDWSTFSYVKTETPNVVESYKITSIKFRYSSVAVAVQQRLVKTEKTLDRGKGTTLGCNIAATKLLNIFYTAYRMVQLPITRSSVVTLEVPFDMPFPPNCVLFKFLRTAEIIHNDEQEVNYCSDISSRPKNLTNLAFLVGHTVERVVYNGYEIDGLEHCQMTEKKHNWMKSMEDSGFMNSKQAGNALEVSRKRPSRIDAPTTSQSVGLFNIFPISVRSETIKQSYSYYNSGSTNIASTLRVEMKFGGTTSEAGPIGNWSLLAVASYLGKATLSSNSEAVKFAPMF